jgi:TatD DNase family protein
MFDSHCHLTDDRSSPTSTTSSQRAWDAGLTGIVTIASDADDARRASRTRPRRPRIRHRRRAPPRRRQAATGTSAIREHARRADAVVAVGETGLDFHYDNSPRDVQRRLFEWHLIQLAAETGPARRRALPQRRRRRGRHDPRAPCRGVLHCFSGGPALLDTALAAGWYVSFAGMGHFRNFDADLLRAVPADRLLVETDSPYLAPVPHRGRRNEPAFVVETCRAPPRIREDPARPSGHHGQRAPLLPPGGG